ncbi:MAG: hypothetical protein PVI11_07660 [Candidatus Aminicenantes bacterium]
MSSRGTGLSAAVCCHSWGSKCSNNQAQESRLEEELGRDWAQVERRAMLR